MAEDLFTRDGFPIGFFFKGRFKQGLKAQVTRLIEEHGGQVLQSDYGADTVLIPNEDDRNYNQGLYTAHPNPAKRKIHVEFLAFPRQCVQNNAFVHSRPKFKGMSGVQAGKGRVEFTKSDEIHLCEFLARMLPDKEQGGRLGLKVYERLLDMARDRPDLYGWGKRHTPEAWKNRYKKFRDIFDANIEDIVREEKNNNDHRWHEDRRLGRGVYGRIHRMQDDSEVEEEVEVDQDVLLEEDDVVEEEPEEEYESEEIQDLHSAKRPRSDRETGPPSAKRTKYGRVSEVEAVRDKGKGRMVEEEEEPAEEDEIHNTSLFSADEDMVLPVDHQLAPPSPDRTLANTSSRNRTQTSGPSFTQDTLVNTSGSTHFEPASHSTSTNRLSSTKANRSAVVGRPTRAEVPTGPPKPPTPATSQHRSLPATSIPAQSPRVPLTRGQAQSRLAITKAAQQPIAPAKRHQKASRKIASTGDGPYRNTRTRSQSVDPPPPLPAMKSRKNTAPVIPEEYDMQEVLDDAQQVTETNREEMDVENLLNADPSTNVPQQEISRQPSIDTDDAQTRRDLRPLPSQYTQAVEIDAGGSRLRAHLMQPPRKPRKYAGSVASSSRYSLPPPPLPRQPLSTIRTRSHHRSNEPLWVKPVPPAAEPHTPQRDRRHASHSSLESYPPTGTKAREQKNLIQEYERHSPYKPPEGTRAAQLSAKAQNKTR